MRVLTIALLLAASATTARAVPTNFVVDALANSSSGGTGVVVGAVTAGQNFTVSVAKTDLWNAGALPRWSNADGLVTTLIATGSDDSGQPAGTLIGQPFPSYTQGNLTAPYGTLVGQIGGIYEVIGTNFNGPAWATGTLDLFYWDSNNSDNTQFVTAAVDLAPVPEPAIFGLFGLGALALGLRRR